ncbi:hypothetical protein [Streptomyces sp. NPDC059446]
MRGTTTLAPAPDTDIEDAEEADVLQPLRRAVHAARSVVASPDNRRPA